MPRKQLYRIKGQDMSYKLVTKEAFYAFMNDKNVHPSPEKMMTYWKTPLGVILGKSSPGYLLEGPIEYWLAG